MTHAGDRNRRLQRCAIDLRGRSCFHHSESPLEADPTELNAARGRASSEKSKLECEKQTRYECCCAWVIAAILVCDDPEVAKLT
jgi:hypothetical protein